MQPVQPAPPCNSQATRKMDPAVSSAVDESAHAAPPAADAPGLREKVTADAAVVMPHTHVLHVPHHRAKVSVSSQTP